MRKKPQEGHLEVVRYFVEHDINVDVLLNSVHTPTMLAVMGGHFASSDILLNVEDGGTTLVSAAAHGYLDIVKYLAEEQGVDVNISDYYGRTALMWASKNSHIQVVRYLVKYCNDINARNVYGDTVLMMAVDGKNLDIVQFLVENCGADVDATSKAGFSALTWAVNDVSVEIVRYLVEQVGVDVNFRNHLGETTFQMAAYRGYQDIQHILKPFLPLPLDTTDTATLPCEYLLIPPKEIMIKCFYSNRNIGGEYLATWLDADAVVKLYIPEVSLSTFEDEQLRHPNVIKIYGACIAGPSLQFFVCEYASKGSLIECILSNSADQSTIWKFLYEAALGLEYFHERGIIHDDLRCSNILIGNDDLAKLSNFGLSGSTKTPHRTASGVVGSMRWQSPEVLKGEPTSTASDVYSFGLCIFEAVTRTLPWGRHMESQVRFDKMRWAPEMNPQDEKPWSRDSWFLNTINFLSPSCSPGDKHDLVWRMCCHDPDKRASISFVVYELECLALNTRYDKRRLQHEPVSTFDDYEWGRTKELWTQIEKYIGKYNDHQYCHAFDELKQVYELLQNSTHRPTVLERFHKLLTEFDKMIKMPSEQAQILRLSSTRATANTLGESAVASEVRTLRWEQQRSEHIEAFVSSVSDAFLAIHHLKSQEERSAFLRTLKREMEAETKYTPDQFEMMKTSYDAIASKIEVDGLLNLTPEWFIPWVCRGKWLDSDVVVKQVFLIGDSEDSSDFSNHSLSADASSTEGSNMGRTEALAIFRREVEIWFRLIILMSFGSSVPVIPFFVCEYATNGTMIDYLRKRPDQLWTVLLGAALGVQYLHARGVVHGDLKGNNIVIGSDKKAKVTDFGLSAIAKNENDPPQISAALHWVAPECFSGSNGNSAAQAKTGPTFASDVYSLGMCIVEALRVVENVEAVKRGESQQPCLPWGSLNNCMVRYHATRGKLPRKPTICENHEWTLVKRMCVFKPQKRIKISTVVDELTRFVNAKDHDATIDSAKPINLDQVPETIAAARTLFTQFQEEWIGTNNVFFLVGSDRLEEIHEHIHNNPNPDCCRVLYTLVVDADVATSKLQDCKLTLVDLTETTMQIYALHRRLDKFCEAYGEC
ncbi:LOW QUALITY PROTEIN: Serine/threonine protein kinase [Phytophthora palmivora]|uniref:Serine/threonine protein kinase n=1 Tax=Phytophthora palmivora TaxID=4796 RepID=A0A2P4Y051_9STRA|nr:LOW QUALITY PROTEIN: Serine/threonine protein kinase [Phytophthora palmivora]